MSAGSSLATAGLTARYNVALPTYLDTELTELQTNVNGVLLTSDIGLTALDKGAGVIAANTLRVTMASDQPEIVVETQLTQGAGVADATTLRAVLATDQTQIPVNTQLTQGAGVVDGTTLRAVLVTDQTQIPVNTQLTQGAGVVDGTTLRAVLATDQTQIPVDTQLTKGAGVVDGTTLRAVLVTDQTQIPVNTQLSQNSGVVDATTLRTRFCTEDITLLTHEKAAGAATANTLRVTVDSGQITGPVATEATLAALNTKVVQDFGVVATAIKVAAIPGNATGIADFGAGVVSAQTPRVIIASDQTVLPVSNGLDVKDFDLIDASSTNIPGNASATLEIIAALSANIKKVKIAETTGNWLELRVGAGNGTLVHYINPGFDGVIDLNIASGSRVSVRAALSVAALTVGELGTHFLG